MIIVKICGGLGNQMFQYAAAKALSLRSNIQLKLDVSQFDKIKTGETRRKYRLGVFPNIKDAFAIEEEVNKLVLSFQSEYMHKIYKIVNQKIFRFPRSYKIEKEMGYNEIVLKNLRSIYLDGYWQSEKYFSSSVLEIKKYFNMDHLRSLPTLAQNIKDIESKVSIGIHVRRGDFVSSKSANQYHGTADLAYYKQAMLKIANTSKKNIAYFVFSDDIEWCKCNLKISGEHHYITSGVDYHDLYLMSICNHNIIANSTFSWWAAWLNNHEDKIIIAPQKWLLHRQDTMDIIPENWITI